MGNDITNERRQTIYSLVECHPNQTVADIVDHTDIPRSSVVHHARILSEENFITHTTKHGHRYYITMTDTRTERDQAEIERAVAQLPDSTRETFDVIHNHNGPLTVSDIATRRDLTPQTITDHLNRLETKKLILRERVGRTTEISIPQKLNEWMN